MHVVEYSPTRVRTSSSTTPAWRHRRRRLDGGATELGGSPPDGWRFRSFEYDGDRFFVGLDRRYVEDDPYSPGVTVMTRTASYGTQRPSAEA